MAGKKKDRAPRPSKDREINPYLASAAEPAPRPRLGSAGAAAVMVFVWTVIGPAMMYACSVLVGRPHGRSVLILALAELLGVMLVLGAFGLTGSGEAEEISGGWRGPARLFAVVHALTLSLFLVTYLLGDRIGFSFFEKDVASVTHNLADAALALVAARHLDREGSRLAARAGRWLAAAMLGAIAAVPVLTRPTHDEMYFTVPSPHAYMVVPIAVALWIGKLAVFGMLWWALARRAGAAPAKMTST